jgi:hypothetical protein
MGAAPVPALLCDKLHEFVVVTPRLRYRLATVWVAERVAILERQYLAARKAR